MAKKININGKLVSRPGVYTLIKSGIKSEPARTDYGTVCIVDTGINSLWGGGKGQEQYEFTTIQDFLSFVKGGPLWDLGSILFKPVPNQNIPGVSKVILIQARETTPATIKYSLTGGSEISFITKDEGINANGVLNTSNELVKGYGSRLYQSNFPSVAPTLVATTTDASGSNPQSTICEALNIQKGATYSLSFNSEAALTYLAKSSSSLELYNAFKALIAADSDISALFSKVEISKGLKLTGIGQTAFTVTTAVQLAEAEMTLEIYAGSYNGLDAVNNSPYGPDTELTSKPTLLAKSPACKTAQELFDWASGDPNVFVGFNVTYEKGLDDSLSANDNDAHYNLAQDAIEDYTSGAFANAVSKAKQADCNFFLTTEPVEEAMGANNVALLNDAILPSKYEKAMVIPGYATSAELKSSADIAKYFDSDKVIVVHGDCLQVAGSNKFKKKSSLWKSAAFLGRLCGLTPQTPITLKRSGIDIEPNPIDEDQQEFALKAGLIVTYSDPELGYNVFLQGVNTLQDNDELVNEDGSSGSVTVKRITAQLNKEIAIYLKRKFFGNDSVGPNRSTVSPEDVQAATETYLLKRVASSENDDLIISFRNVTSTVASDTVSVQYEFVPNFEVNKMVVTGVILDK